MIIPPDIKDYSTLNRMNFYRQTSKEWKQRNYICPETHKIMVNQYSEWNTPWDFVNNDPKRVAWCRAGQDLAEMYQMVPPFCVSCWKVVVKPQKHSELIQLRDIQREMALEDPAVWCKCGIEQRPYVPGLYGGYFYTDSKEDGLNRLEQVRDVLWSKIPDIPICLKRYCTEFEKSLGDSIDTEKRNPKDAQDIQDFYLAHLKKTQVHPQQPRIIKLEVYQGWIDWGWKFGTDEDRKEIEDTYNDEKPLYPKPRTYERGENENV